MQNEQIFMKSFGTTDGNIIECAIPEVVVYSLEFSCTIETRGETFRTGKRYCFSCIADSPADMKDDILSDLLWRFDCCDEDEDDISVLSFIKEDSIRIEFKHKLR